MNELFSEQCKEEGARLDDYHLSWPLFSLPYGYGFKRRHRRSPMVDKVYKGFSWMVDLGFFRLYEKKYIEGDG